MINFSQTDKNNNEKGNQNVNLKPKLMLNKHTFDRSTSHVDDVIRSYRSICFTDNYSENNYDYSKNNYIRMNDQISRLRTKI